MPLDALLVAAGLVLLLGGAWLVVRSASNLAALFGLSPVLIGATVVAFGTSAPEFVVSLVASVQGSDGIAVGNVVGSNITNVGLVLGITALIAPVGVHSRLLRWEIPVLGAATLAVIVLAFGGVLQRIEGVLLFAGLIAFVVLSVRLFPEIGEEAGEVDESAVEGRSPFPEVGLLVVGLLAIGLGAELLVRGATGIAEAAGLSEVAIGVVIVAVGTSLPEVSTSAVAAFRREHDIAVANVVGSNIFNLLGVLGLTATVATVEVAEQVYELEIWVLAASTLVLLPLAWPRALIDRKAGAALLAAYIAFTAVVLSRDG